VLPFLWGAPRQAWRSLAAGVAALIAMSCALVGTGGTIAYAQALRRFSPAAHGQSSGDGLALPSLYAGWLRSSAAPWITTALTIALVLCAVGLICRWLVAPSNAALASLCLVATLLSPYSHQYDSVALFPALLVAFTECEAMLLNRNRADPRFGDVPAAATTLMLRRSALYLGLAIVLVSPFMAISALSFSFRLYPAGIVLVLAALQFGFVPDSVDTRAPCARQALAG
jgi:hypothetical protein